MQAKRLVEWAESPITTEILDLIRSHVKELREVSGVDCYSPFNPHKTQELMAGLNGSLDTWDIVQDLLAGDWTFFDEEEDEK